MKAIILAGGKGTRLGSKDVPKPMRLIGGKSLLEIQINILKKYDICDIVLITGYMSSYIENYFGDGSNLGVNISYFIEKEPLGTTGGIKAIEKQLREDFFVIYGDVIFDIDLDNLKKFHAEKNSECTLVLHPNDHPDDSDLVEIDSNNRIINFYPKYRNKNNYYRNLVNAAIYIFSPSILQYIESGKKSDFGKDIFPFIFDKLKMFGYITAEYIKDIGTPYRLQKVTEDYLSGKIERMNMINKRKAVFLDRDGVINVEKNIICRSDDFELLPLVVEAIKLINDTEYLVVVVTNQPGIAKNMCSIGELQIIHNKMEYLLGKMNAKIDAIYYCPHHPDIGFKEENRKYKIKCSCRKPEPGMILQAVKDFNIDLNSSFIIGDSYRDIECGKRIGLTTIGVKTGYGCMDNDCNPDHIFDNLLDAANFICNS
ncbi:HAD-IIIA family hydrolase [Geosporobacter ferrireducens]|uniref:D,D-heptose 1,7-bisphosphate phosphatase n=1 Tax=Geosporobacter ferrireducens TaxID=1424294 RepID=A0A1D8GI49_9FIRM|nr:HAD-IIIA family hydrolase [Geosporobacter ferrireducens]AOT70577.1 hypothetical protein Gferi_13945 [Geosporobacter ferrireducens]